MKKKPDKHVFVCINCRDNNTKSCGEKGLEIRTELVKLLSKADQKSNIRINKSGCLDLCESGPCMVVYPQKIWYKNLSLEDCEEILKESILSDNIIERLKASKEDWKK